MFRAKFKRYKRDLEAATINGTASGVFAIAGIVRNRSSRLAPIDTGRLRGSLRREKSKKGIMAFVYTLVNYAKYQEKQNPFMKPAVDGVKSQVSGLLTKFLRLAYKKAPLRRVR